MKLLIVTPHYPPAHVGGVEMYAYRHAHWMHRAGHQVDVVCIEQLGPGRSVTATHDTSGGFPVHRLTLGIDDTQNFRLLHEHDALRAWCEAMMRDRQSDVVHVHSGYLVGAPVLAAAQALTVPTVLSLHDFWFICPRLTLLHPAGTCCTGPDDAAKCTWCLRTEQRRYLWADTASGGATGALARVLMRAGLVDRSLTGAVESRNEHLRTLLRGVDRMLAPSRFLRDLMVHAGVSSDRMQLQPTGIEPLPRWQPRPHGGSPLRIGYTGRIVEPKGVHVLFEAARALPFADWVVTAHGPTDVDPRYVDRLKGLAAGDPRFQFAGPFGATDQSRVFADLDVLVVPSVWYENRPFVILEALSAGLPVVASRLGGMAELIDHGRTGLLFEPGDAADLAVQLTRLRRDRALVDALRSEPATVVTLDDELFAIQSLYQELAE